MIGPTPCSCLDLVAPTWQTGLNHPVTTSSDGRVSSVHPLLRNRDPALKTHEQNFAVPYYTPKAQGGRCDNPPVHPRRPRFHMKPHQDHLGRPSLAAPATMNGEGRAWNTTQTAILSLSLDFFVHSIIHSSYTLGHSLGEPPPNAARRETCCASRFGFLEHRHV